MARLSRALAKNDNCKLSALRTTSGKLTSSSKEVGKLLLTVHFPGCHIIDNEMDSPASTNMPLVNPNWDLADRLITREVLHWSIFSFAPFKSGGPDGVFPAELQYGFPFIKDHLLYLFQACIAFSVVAQSWNRNMVVFILKAGKTDYTDPKAFRPISLSSTLLKALERIVDRYIRDQYLSIIPLSNMQHAYRVGKSCETALHELVVRIERALNNKEFLLATFMDISGAFDSTSFDSIINACFKFGIDHSIVKWIEYMLKSRHVQFEFNGQLTSVSVAKKSSRRNSVSSLVAHGN